jgi:hypothetical protein
VQQEGKNDATVFYKDSGGLPWQPPFTVSVLLNCPHYQSNQTKLNHTFQIH